MESKWFNEKEKLEQMILIDKMSYEEIGKMYGCTGSNIKKVASRIGIKLPQRRKINQSEYFNKGTGRTSICLNCNKEFKAYNGLSGKYCCSQCEKEYKHLQKYKLILEGDQSIMRANYSPKAFRQDIIKEQGGVCAICGMKPEWNNKELIFIIDHMDGKASNNRRDNLRCICPNCDSQLDTYKSKNKNSDRIYHKLNHR